MHNRAMSFLIAFAILVSALFTVALNAAACFSWSVYCPDTANNVDEGEYTIYEIQTSFSPGCRSTYYVSFSHDGILPGWSVEVLDAKGIVIPPGMETVLSGIVTYVFSLKVTCPPGSAGEEDIITTNIEANDYYNQDEIKSVITTTTVNMSPHSPNPVVLSLDSATQTSLNLSWTKSDLDVLNFARYELHMSLVPGFTPVTGTKIATITDINTITYEVKGLSQETTYYFCIRVWDKTANPPGPFFADSNILAATTLGANAPPKPVFLNTPFDITNIAANLSWTQNTEEDFARYEIHVSTTPGFTPSQETLFGDPINNPADLESMVSGLAENTTYYFKIRVYDTGGLFGDSNEESCTTLDYLPEYLNLEFPFNTNSSATKLRWTQSCITDFDRYEVHVSETENFIPDDTTKFTDIDNISIKTVTVTGLDAETKYYFRIRLVDKSGNYMDTNCVYTTTMDVSLPTITFTAPYDGETGVDLTQNIVVTFSEQMDLLSVLYSCSPNPGGWGFAWSEGKTITYTHNPFVGLTTYTFQITAAKDIFGNDLVAGSVPNPFSFTTRDATPPTVISTSPLDSAEDVPITSTISITFSEAMDCTSVEGCLVCSFSYQALTWDGNTLIITPSNDLDYSTQYTITIPSTACDTSGTSMESAYTFGFLTEDEPEVPPEPKVNHAPTVVVTAPDNQEADKSFDIQYTAEDSDGDILLIAIFYDNDADLSNGGLVLIGSQLTNNGAFTWDTTNIPSGTYYIYIIANDGQTEAGSYSGMLTINHPAPPEDPKDPDDGGNDPVDPGTDLSPKGSQSFSWTLLWIILLITVSILLAILLYAKKRRGQDADEIECPSCGQNYTPFDMKAETSDCPHCGETNALK